MSIDNLTHEEKEKIEIVVRLSQLDQTFRKRVLADPKEVLIEIGFVLPTDVSVIAYDLPTNTIGLVLPSLLLQSQVAKSV
jgi:hypothetical protein